MVWRSDRTTKVWSELPAFPTTVNNYTSIGPGMAYFPERASVVIVQPGSPDQVFEWDTVARTWRGLAQIVTGNYQISAEYNPVHKVVLIAGGVAARHALRRKRGERRHHGKVEREFRRVAHRPRDLAPRRLLRRERLRERIGDQLERGFERVAGKLRVVRVEVQRYPSERRHHVAYPRHLAPQDGECQPLHDAVHLEVEGSAELDIRRRITERNYAQRPCLSQAAPRKS